MLTLVVPTYGGVPNVRRTVESAKGACNDVVIVSTAPHEEDNEAFAQMGQVVPLPWNFVFYHGFGSLYNQGTPAAKNDWLVLLGTGETMQDVNAQLRSHLSAPDASRVFTCFHHNDPHQWKRIWNRTGGTMWSGLIHEEIVGGRDAGLLFRMQDTAKTPEDDPVKNEVFRYLKTLSYHRMYHELLHHPEKLGGTNPGWVDFVHGSRAAIERFMTDHADLYAAVMNEDFFAFRDLVRQRMNAGQKAEFVNFQPQGT